MAFPSASDAADKWASGLTGARGRMQAGAESVPVSPGILAARQADVWAANTMASKPKYKTNVGAVTKEYWVNQYVNKGLDRVASGAAASKPKMEDFLGKLFTYQDQALRTLPARGTYEQNKQRMLAWTDKMHGFSYKGGV